MFLVLFVLVVNTINAQFQNNEPLYIGDNGYVYIGADTYYFGTSSGQTTTTRTPLTHGKLIFSSTSTTNGASDAHYLDGYGSVITTTPFILPVGQSGICAPARVTPSSLAPVDVAYYRASANSIGNALDATISSVSNNEYWDIRGLNSAVISLTWRTSSAISAMVASTSDLTIAGFNGVKWVQIPSSVDGTSILGGSSTTANGSITTLANVNLSTFYYFTIAVKGIACPPLIPSSGVTKTWSGSWIPSSPTLSDPVVINTAYSAGSFACNSLVLNADVTLADGQNIEIINGATGAAKIIMSSEASVLQRASSVSAPKIELTKRTRSVMRRFDYVYWGTPISGNAFSQLSGAQASTASLANAFDLKYKYVTGAGGGWQTLTTTEVGKGFIARIKQQAPFSNATNTDFINLKFTGVANNGDIALGITNNLSSPNGGTSHVLLSNPYPSAIDAYKFLEYNTDIDGVVYLWTSGTVNNGGSQLYTQADYIAYTLAGNVVPSNIPSSFNGKIASGQGFKVKSLTNSGTVTFTNCMRLTDNNNQFNKTSQETAILEPKDRFKLNMTGNNGVFSQILIAYLPQASLNYDRMYDAGRNSVSTAQLYSVFEGDGRKLAINARPNFFDTDIVPLGISKSNTTQEDFTISISEKEGVFNTNGVQVYLHDNLVGTYFNLANGDYTFSTNTTSLEGRFEIVYQSNALANNQFDFSSVVANIKNQTLNIKASLAITNVEIYDISGKKIYETKVENNTNFSTPFNHAQAIYIVKVKLENEKIASIKLINEK